MPSRPLSALLLLLALAGTLSPLPGTVLPSARAEPSPHLSTSDLEAGRLPKAAFLRRDDQGRHVYASVIGPLAVSDAFVQRGTRAGRRALGRALAGAQAAALATRVKPWTWKPLAPVGGLLIHPTIAHIVIDGTALAREAVSQRQPQAEKQRIIQAAEAYISAGMPQESISPWMAGALADLVRRLDDDPGNPALGTLDGNFARRVFVQDGWLACVAGPAESKLRAALLAAVTDALALLPEQRFRAEGRSLLIFGNAWGTQGLVLRTKTRNLLVRRAPLPMDAQTRRKALSTCRLVYDLPQGADALTQAQVVTAATAAAFVQGEVLLAEWSHAAGFRADQAAWRRVFPTPKAESTLVRQAWPPHLPLVGPGGTLHGVALPGGVLQPAQDTSAAEAERFLDDAARLLPSASYLDLIQQYFLRYTWDSPDLTQPLMLGCEKFHDEIHQTAQQVLATCCGGICRGDCDDVAEFIQSIAQRQGKLAHVVSLPGHLATIWAEPDGDAWRAFVFQSGPTHEFQHAELPVALEQAYLALDKNAPFDRNNVNVSLRFAGQNTRSPYGLSWRIFADRTYAEAMIDVQADWNRMTLLRAEQKMLRRLAAGDQTSASYGELAALYDWMARPDKAIAFAQRDLKLRSDPESRLLKNVELIANFVEAKRLPEAQAALAQLLEKDLPALAPVLGLRAPIIGLELAGLIATDAPLLAAQTLAAIVRLKTETVGTSLADLQQARKPIHSWRKHDANEALQSFLESYAWTALEVLRHTRGQSKSNADVALLRTVLDLWLRRHVFDDADEPEEIGGRWALLARRRALDDPDFLQHVAATAAPAGAGDVNPAALARRATDELVRSWTRASPSFFAYQISDLLSVEEQRPDPQVIRRLSGWMSAAEDTARRLGLYGPATQTEQRTARLRVALVLKDEAALRTVLRESHELKDRYVSESIAAALGWSAVHLDLPWWRKVVECWVEEIDNPVHYFHIAWRAASVNAKVHALHVAKVAAQRYPDNSAIQEEARMMAAYLGK